MMSESVDKDGALRSFTDTPLSHFIFKIESFSLLAKNTIEKYESGEFEAGGFKWKLVIYPNGNKSNNVEDHISLYLVMADTKSLGLGWEVNAVFQLFLLDQKKDKYLIVQGEQRRFYPFKLQRGYDHFIPMKEFINPSNGYLVEDTCVFGADVLVKNNTIPKGECLSSIKDASSFKHVWKIDSFSKVQSEFIFSEVFNVGDHGWKIKLYPKGSKTVNGSHLSVYLCRANQNNMKFYLKFTLRIVDQLQAKHKEINANKWFTFDGYEGLGSRSVVSLGDFNHSSNGYLVKDVCVVEAEVTLLAIARAL